MTDKAKRVAVEQYPEASHYEPGMITVEGDLVVAHGRYFGGGKTLIAADFFRFEGDFIVEHWDVLQEEVVGLCVGVDAFGGVVVDSGKVAVTVARQARFSVLDALRVAGQFDTFHIDILRAA